jgi:bifunctional non-homologous end joining protein LigD
MAAKPLDEYRAKRSPDATTEPMGAPAAPAAEPRARRFVVQKHAARRTHYDLRLEWGGVLRSWAVPKGPSRDPAEKRLAVAVEDHPLEYAGFEGRIPEGNYGAGAVIVWDRGRFEPVGDFAAGLEAGKLLFDLEGYKLRGRWTLVRLKKSEGGKDWLLIKEKDGFARAGEAAALPEESVLSGLTVEEMADAPARAAALREEAVRAGARPGAPRAEDVELMLAESREKPFTAPGWLFEIKYDGFRLLAAREGGRARLLYRRGRESTAVFPDVAAAVAALPFEDALLDGEVVVLDEQGRPSFERLQERVMLERPADIERAAIERPAVLFAFDLLALEGLDLRPLPLRERKRLLARVLPRVGPLRLAEHIEERGEAMLDEVRRLGLEGIVAKRADSAYRGGRSPDWVKVRIERTGDFAVVGFTAAKGARTGFGALHLAGWDGEKLVYVGRVGTGFAERELARTRATLDAARRATPPCEGPLPGGRGHVWVEPRLLAEVRYKDRTRDGLLRQPAFLRFRDDKRIEDCDLPAPRASDAAPPEAPGPAPVAEKKVAFTNLEKPFWPEEGYKKGDLIEYYRAVAPALLTYLRDRPLVMTRFPDGIAGKSFYQKDAPAFAPAWLRRARIWSESTAREIDYFVCDDLESLLYVANLGTIPLHIWSSRVETIERPDWSILDLDPKGAPFRDVVKVALAIRALADEMELPALAKTSGSSGIHVLVPLGARTTYAESRGLAELMARVIERRLPEIATTERVIERRGGRVYIDYLQNRHGQLIAAPYSVRPLAGAPVSTPLAWREVGPRLDPKKFTIATVPARLAKLGEDPMRSVLELAPDLRRALERLGERLRA